MYSGDYGYDGRDGKDGYDGDYGGDGENGEDSCDGYDFYDIDLKFKLTNRKTLGKSDFCIITL